MKDCKAVQGFTPVGTTQGFPDARVSPVEEPTGDTHVGHMYCATVTKL